MCIRFNDKQSVGDSMVDVDLVNHSQRFGDRCPISKDGHGKSMGNLYKWKV